MVAGYDRTSTTLTQALFSEGMSICYNDDIDGIPETYKDLNEIESVLIIYTPAVPADSVQLRFFQEKGYHVYKRSQVLGEISRQYKAIAVGGSHGKTTISAMIAEIFRISDKGCSAFLGGISKGLDSNLLLTVNSDWAVFEADEFDRSFLFLYPDFALVTSMDSDHLDIYGDTDQLRDSFEAFLNRLEENGTAVLKEGLQSIVPASKMLNVKYYELDSVTDYYAINIEQNGLFYCFDLHTPRGIVKGLVTAVPGWINIENAVGAAAISLEAGVTELDIRKGIANFQGIRRRFDVRIMSPEIVYIDDYAHHPNEIRSFLISIKKLFPDKKITGVFQPHLFTRTRDLAKEFGLELSLLDELILLDIYPARERAIEGVSAGLIYDEVEMESKSLHSKETLLKVLEERDLQVLVTMGAGDIDQLVDPIENYLSAYVA